MPNYNKQKGDRFQRAVLTATLGTFPEAWITRAGWDTDRGDIITHKDKPRFTIQAKDSAQKLWLTWFTQLDQQIANAEATAGVLVLKQRGIADAGEALAVMRYREWLVLAGRAR
jgi:hypothetical protein